MILRATPANPEETGDFSKSGGRNGGSDSESGARGALDVHALDAPPHDAQSGPWQILDDDLAQVVEAWPTLPEPTRAAVLRLVAHATEGAER